MTTKNPRPLTQPEPGDPNYQKSYYQPGSLHTTDLPMQPSLGELLREPKSEEVVRKHDDSMSPSAIYWRRESVRLANEHVDPIVENTPAVVFDHKACILCDHVIVQKILGNKCGQSGSLCCNLKECPITRREAAPVPAVKEEIPCCENNCPAFGILPSDDSCAGDEVCEIRGCTIHPMIKSWIEIHGCLHHPGARVYLNKDVIVELDRRIQLCIDEDCDHSRLYVETYKEVIALLRGDVE